eukprot:15004824-Alexandrium_andersonii.AAC.1
MASPDLEVFAVDLAGEAVEDYRVLGPVYRRPADVPGESVTRFGRLTATAKAQLVSEGCKVAMEELRTRLGAGPAGGHPPRR